MEDKGAEGEREKGKRRGKGRRGETERKGGRQER